MRRLQRIRDMPVQGSEHKRSAQQICSERPSYPPIGVHSNPIASLAQRRHGALPGALRRLSTCVAVDLGCAARHTSPFSKGGLLDFENPSSLFVFVDGVLAPRLFRSFYSNYAKSVELRGNEAVLEFGCGSGGIAECLVPRLTEGSITCIDICPPMLRIAERRLRNYSNTRCVLGHIEKLELPASSFDVLVIHLSLIHI